MNVKVRIRFSQGIALFEDQILTSRDFGDVGDSGALVMIDTSFKFSIGMLIGGGPDGYGIASELLPVLQRFGVTLCAPTQF